MPEQKKPPKEKSIGDEIVGGITAARHPGYAAYKREAEAMGEKVLSPQEWAKKNGK